MQNILSMQRILLALGVIVFVGAAVASATGAFFNDTETSTGNIFVAGAQTLLRSTDEGDSWTSLNVPFEQLLESKWDFQQPV